MKKIPTLFKRLFEGGNIVSVLPETAEGLEYILTNEDVVPTVKWDGSCCALIGGKFYKRYDAKRGKTPPSGAIPCCGADPVTGHWPHWVEIKEDDPADRWFVEAFLAVFPSVPSRCEFTGVDGTFEAIGPHFQGNPYKINRETRVRHGTHPITNLEMTYEGIKDYLKYAKIEGIVFWYHGEPVCKIKRTDFGFEWPTKLY